MMFVKPSDKDWNLFKRWAKEEGWSLYRKELADAVLALKEKNNCCGFVTAVAYEKSGWIGNLIVPEHRRGKGYGRALFEKTIQALEQKGLDSIWLTASKSGQPLYQQYDFKAIGSIERFVLHPDKIQTKTAPTQTIETLLAADAACWNVSRAALLSALTGQSRVFTSGKSGALLQQHADFQIIGPWYSPARATDELSDILQKCRSHLKPGIPAVVDIVNDQTVLVARQ